MADKYLVLPKCLNKENHGQVKERAEARGYFLSYYDKGTLDRHLLDIKNSYEPEKILVVGCEKQDKFQKIKKDNRSYMGTKVLDLSKVKENCEDSKINLDDLLKNL